MSTTANIYCVNPPDDYPSAIHASAITAHKIIPESGEPEITFLLANRWPPNRTVLYVGFVGPANDAQKNIVKNSSKLWLTKAGLQFTFPPNAAPFDILVSFDPTKPPQSEIGTQSLQKTTQGLASLNLPLVDTMNPMLAMSIVLHEFGHALGCVHEHQKPGTGIVWNNAQVYADRRARNWPDPVTVGSILATYNPNFVGGSGFDPLSIMMYEILPGWATINNLPFVAPYNYQLSANDVAWMGAAYPPPHPEAEQT